MKLKMRTTATLLIAILMTSAMVFAVSAIAKKNYATIQDGTIKDVNGNPITVGYDQWGYNYQAHMFNGWYWNNLRPEVPWTEETLIAAGKSTTWLMMKWSDVWLSNADRDNDNLLDRGYTKGSEGPYTSSGVEGAWLTNHQSGVNDDGTHWTYFVKIAFPGDDAVLTAGVWYTADGVEIGTNLWGHARILQISNDPNYDEHGVYNNWEAPTGFGYYK